MKPKRRQPEPRRPPVANLQGRFLCAQAAIAEAERLLPTYRGPDGDHEGVVFFLGREVDERLTLITTALAPPAEHDRGRVMCSASHVAQVADAARSHGLALLAQLHSHPGCSTHHSRGDDHLVLMPFEGMLSIVAPHYGRHGLRPLDGLGVHQYQTGRWVLLDRLSVRAGITIIPTSLDLR